jgi:hypothetical protein
LSIRFPRFELNQKWRGGCQSIAAAAAVLKSVSGLWPPARGSMRTVSAGFTELSQLATNTGAADFSGIASPVYTPSFMSNASFTGPPAAGIVNSFSCARSSASR